MDKKSWIFAGVAVGSLILGMFLGIWILTGFNVVDAEASTAIATWAGALGTFIAFVGVLVTTKIQMNNQRMNLQEQIENQNKQMHRPVLDIELCEKKSISQKESSTEIICLSKQCANKEVLKTNKSFLLEMSFINMGKGPALNILFYDCYAEQFSPLSDFFEVDEENKVREDGITSMIVHVSRRKEKRRILSIEYIGEANEVETASLLVFYSDINGNVYKTLIWIILFVDNKGHCVMSQYSKHYEQSKYFDIELRRAKNNININKIEDKYIERAWNKTFIYK